MNYLSTRNKNYLVSAAEAIAMGISPDGGLFVPEKIPTLSIEDIKTLCVKKLSGKGNIYSETVS